MRNRDQYKLGIEFVVPINMKAKEEMKYGQEGKSKCRGSLVRRPGNKSDVDHVINQVWTGYQMSSEIRFQHTIS